MYIGYILALKLRLLLVRRKTDSVRRTNSARPTVTVIITAYNEEKAIRQRIENLVDQDYPDGKLEVIVASDGSTDRTVETIRHQERLHVRILGFRDNRGRAAVQNEAVAMARGDIVVFTDAATSFDAEFVKKISVSFVDRRVGCAVGNLVYEKKDTGIGAAEGIYWQFEKKLRNLESKLGLLATGTGACMAVRRRLYRPLSPIDDCDFITPLDVILQGYQVVYVPGARAHDAAASTVRGEIKTRIRQTSRNIVGTLKKWSWTNWFNHPVVSWGLISHKLLRWMTPFLLAGLLVSNFFLVDESLYRCTLALQGVFYLAGAAGFVIELLGRRLPVISPIFSFLLACIGMGLGVLTGFLGKAPKTYEAAE